ncbi:hypothetical protein BaRGS_00027389 [Batillaria attramentaria]|uniref:Phosphorylated adapter RNA export protein n=1 Tax=Batillaria attramentaria TaxID=370345 RepID=A0ABD0K249_9CAEN
MAAVEEEIEEGEITDSDSMGDEESVKENGATGKLVVPANNAAVKQYSIFGDNPRPAQTFQPIEQILTAEVGGFTMERKVESDRDVESYDYTRAAVDDRPDLDETEIHTKDTELFGEVIDLDKAAASQQHGQNRKRARDRLGERQNVKGRLHGHHHRVTVTESSSSEEVVYHISSKLHESKVHLIRRVVQEVGRAKALALLRKTDETEAAGGMMTMNGSRRRTPGGVFLQLLKADADVSKEQHDKIFEEENRWLVDQKRRKRAKARQRKKQKELAQASSEDKGDNTKHTTEPQSGAMEMEGSGSAQAISQHVKDSKEGAGSISDGAVSDEAEEGEESDSDSRNSFSTELQQEFKRQERERDTRTEGMRQCDVDVLQIEAEDDLLD